MPARGKRRIYVSSDSKTHALRCLLILSRRDFVKSKDADKQVNLAHVLGNSNEHSNQVKSSEGKGLSSRRSAKIHHSFTMRLQQNHRSVTPFWSASSTTVCSGLV